MRTVLAALLPLFSVLPASAQPRGHFRLAWTTHVGWMPWAYAAKQDVATRAAAGKLSGVDLEGFEARLKTIKLFAAPKDAAEFTRSSG